MTIDHHKTFQTQTLNRVMNIMNGSFSDRYKSSDPYKFLNDPENKPTREPDWFHYYANGFGGVRPLQILVEIKSKNSDEAWPQVIHALQPFREKGWLTTYKNGRIHYGPLIVVGTGGTPLEQVAPKSKRDYFYDCPLGSMDKINVYGGVKYHFNATLCPFSSDNYVDEGKAYFGLTPPPKDIIKKDRAAIEQAHKHNSTARFYGIVPFPPDSKYADYNMLVEQGIDWLNLDDLNDAEAYSP